MQPKQQWLIVLVLVMSVMFIEIQYMVEKLIVAWWQYNSFRLGLSSGSFMMVI